MSTGTWMESLRECRREILFSPSLHPWRDHSCRSPRLGLSRLTATSNLCEFDSVWIQCWCFTRGIMTLMWWRRFEGVDDELQWVKYRKGFCQSDMDPLNTMYESYKMKRSCLNRMMTDCHWSHWFLTTFLNKRTNLFSSTWSLGLDVWLLWTE